MSGSGSSLFTLFDEREEADRAAELISKLDRPMRSRVEIVQLAPHLTDDVAARGE